ncbi:hypothetical protein Bca4012_024574 [Brassica carinata]
MMVKVHRQVRVHEGKEIHLLVELQLKFSEPQVKCYMTQILKGSIIVPLIIVGIDFMSTSSIIGGIYAISSINKDFDNFLCKMLVCHFNGFRRNSKLHKPILADSPLGSRLQVHL